MMLHIPHVLSKDQVQAIRSQLEAASWQDGSSTAGAQATQRKRNLQLTPNSELAMSLGQLIGNALKQHALFVSAVLPKHVLMPLFNRYEGGGTYGNHVDGAIHVDPNTKQLLRTDVSTTVFLSEPNEYEGGELMVEDTYGTHEVKLDAGDAIIYPATSLHRVEPVTQGTRFAAFMWSQSMVKDDWQRTMLFNLDMTIMRLRELHGDTEEIVNLTAHYHNLIRQWAAC